MGTDIHPIVQVQDDCGCWEVVDIPRNSDYGNIIDGRNYNWFAVLGNVRNGTGFAGIRTSAGFVPISSDRGYPEDFGFPMEEYGYYYCPRHRDQPAISSAATLLPENAILHPSTGTALEKAVDLGDAEQDLDDARYECTECFWLGEHSHSWVTAQELIDYDWTGQHTALVGVMPLRPPITAAERKMAWHDTYYTEWMKHEHFLDDMPPSYSGGVTGASIITLDEPQIQAMLRAEVDRFEPGKTYYVRLARKINVLTAVGSVATRTIEWLKTLHEDPTKVRIVFGFDS